MSRGSGGWFEGALPYKRLNRAETFLFSLISLS